MQDAIEKETTLNVLMRSRHNRGDATSSDRVDAIATQRGLPASLVPQYLNDLYTLAVTETNPHKPFTVRLMELCDRVCPRLGNLACMVPMRLPTSCTGGTAVLGARGRVFPTQPASIY